MAIPTPLILLLGSRAKVLKAFAQAAKASKNVRQVLVLTAKLMMAKKVTSFAELAGQKEIRSLVAAFTTAEMEAYTKNLVPLGFPTIAVLRKVPGKKIKEEALDVVTDATEVQKSEVLQDHIEHLRAESFFQKAHREAKKQNIIGRSPDAREWYHDYALEYGTSYSYTTMLKEGGMRASKPMRGKMMFFRYRPEQLTSEYDLYPLIFVLDRKPNYFTGINFHYLVPKMRAELLGDMFSYLSNLSFDISTELNFKSFTNAIASNKKFKFGKAALRRYTYSNVQSKMIEVHPLDWELAIMVETSKFFNEKGSRATKQSIWKETRINAVTN